MEFAKSLVVKTVDYATEMNTSDPKWQSLRKDLGKLRLDDITVDVESTELAMHEEMALLRNAVKSGVCSVASDVDDASSSARVKALETENANLRGLLKELKAELNSGRRGGSRSASPSNVPAEDTSDLQRQLKAKDDTIAALRTEIEALRSAASGASASATAAAKLTSEKEQAERRVSELQASTAELTSRLEEVQRKAHADRDELMEAMAQEMEVGECVHCGHAGVCTDCRRCALRRPRRKGRRSWRPPRRRTRSS